MKVVVIYKTMSDHARPVEEFLHDFHRLTGRDLEVIDPESRDGIGFCEVYDVMEYPTVLAFSDDGQVQNKWPGLPLPTLSEVSYYG